MKRFLSLMIIVASILSFCAFSVSADSGVKAILKIEGDTGAVGDMITMTYTIEGATTLYAFQERFEYNNGAITPWNSKNEAVCTYDSSTKTYSAVKRNLTNDSILYETFYHENDDEDYSIWGTTEHKIEVDEATNKATLTMYASKANSKQSALYEVSGSSIVISERKFKRSSTEPLNIKIPSDATGFSVETTSSSGEMVANGIGSVVLDYTAPGGNTGWTETDGTTTVTVKFPTTSTEKAGDESSWTGNSADQATIKKVVFGKNETGSLMKGATYDKSTDTFTAGGYFVEYEGQKFYGIQDVPVGSSWAILIIESAN